MPIRPEMKAKYPTPKVWRAIRARILKRAAHRCEFCRVPNYEGVVRSTGESFRIVEGLEAEVAVLDGEKVVWVVLTIAHLDHDPGNNNDDNLRALCQQCHLRHDATEHARNAAVTRARRKDGPLFAGLDPETPGA